jgi:hypothetical protein
MARTETLRTYVYWKISKWSVPKHCELTTYRNWKISKWSVPKHCELTSSVKFPNGPYRNIANLRLLENFQMVRTETLQTHDFWKISKESVPKHCELTTTGKFPNSPYRNIAMLQNRIPRNTEKSFVGLRMRT